MCHNRRMIVENNNWKSGRQAEKWRQENLLLLCFCPHFFAFSAPRWSRPGRPFKLRPN
jgi:hypothetical protein